MKKRTNVFILSILYIATMAITTATATDRGTLSISYSIKEGLATEETASLALKLQTLLYAQPDEELPSIWSEIEGDLFLTDHLSKLQEVLLLIPGNAWLNALIPTLESAELSEKIKIKALECMTLIAPFSPSLLPHLIIELPARFRDSTNQDSQIEICKCFTTIATVSPELSSECWNYIKGYLTLLSTLPASSNFHLYMEHFGKIGEHGDTRTARAHLAIIEFLLTVNLEASPVERAPADLEEDYAIIISGGPNYTLEHKRIIETCIEIAGAHPDLMDEARRVIETFLNDPRLNDPRIADFLVVDTFVGLALPSYKIQKSLRANRGAGHTPTTRFMYSLLSFLAMRHPEIAERHKHLMQKHHNDFGLEPPY